MRLRLFYPGQLVLPLMFILGEGLFLMRHLDIIRVGWPLVLIGVGLEELYLWAHGNEGK
jgi:hypothetical protein